MPSTYKRVLPLVKWAGGKTKMLKHIMPLISGIPHTTYVEPFAGGAAALLTKPPSKTEVINDINNDLINLYRQGRSHPQALLSELRHIPFSRTEFYRLRDTLATADLTEIQRAAYFLYCNFYCFGADGKSFAVLKTHPKTRSAWLKKIALLSRRLDRVTIECLDWQRCIKLYDSPATLFFIDPPYTAGQTYLYSVWSHDDLTALHQVLLNLKGNWILTINDSPSNRDLFKLHPQKIIPSLYCLSKNDGSPRPPKSELLICNLPFPGLSIQPL